MIKTDYTTNSHCRAVPWMDAMRASSSLHLSTHMHLYLYYILENVSEILAANTLAKTFNNICVLHTKGMAETTKQTNRAPNSNMCCGVREKNVNNNI